jgi:hypothetical protein
MPIEQTASRIAELGAGDPVRVAEALAAGVTRAALRAAIDGGLLMRPAHGFVAPRRVTSADAMSEFIARCRALQDRRPRSVLSHTTAAVLTPLPSAGRPSAAIHCIDPNPRPSPGFVCHRGTVPDCEIVEVDGLRVTSPLRTAVDLAMSSPLPQALVTMDAALRLRTLALSKAAFVREDRRVEDPTGQALARAELQQSLAACGGRPGAAEARRAAHAASPLAESPAESWSRGHLLIRGVVPLGLQARVIDAEGRQRRLDFLLAEGLAGEVDGMVKYDVADGARRLREEKTRDLLLERVGIRTVRWTGVEVFRDPAAVVDLVRRTIEQHAAARSRRSA